MAKAKRHSARPRRSRQKPDTKTYTLNEQEQRSVTALLAQRQELDAQLRGMLAMIADQQGIGRFGFDPASMTIREAPKA